MEAVATAARGQVERSLLRYLGSTAAARTAHEPKIQALAERADAKLFHQMLASQALLALLGSRVLAVAPGAMPDWFAGSVAHARERTRQWTLVVESLTLRLAGELELAGIPAVALKGPFLARDIHGDTGLRYCGDVDLLVDAPKFRRAVAVVRRMGYEPVGRTNWSYGLPLFETTLQSTHAHLPALDLHWRVHWFESASASRMIGRSRVVQPGERRLALADELASLLLFYSRDGFWGLRLATDIAAWWDRFGEDLPPRALVPLVRAHPELGPALRASAAAAERLVGFPAGAVLDERQLTPPVRRAVRMANWGGGVRPAQHRGTLALVDCLLSPRRGLTEAVRRHLLPPDAALREMYSFDPGSRRRSWQARFRYGLLVGAQCLPGIAGAFWRTRGRRSAA